MTTHRVRMDWVKEHLNDPHVRLIDCRFVLGQPAVGRAAYEAEHLPGAIHFDLEQDLASSKAEHGGRHPMPDLDAFVAKLGQAGIDGDTTVVAYDDQGGAMASRFWWLLHYLGHTKTYVMDGKFAHWKAAGHPLTAEKPTVEPKTFVPHVQADRLVHIHEVRAKRGQEGVVLIDSREAKRYLGIEEAVDKKAGHIPGAKNFFWKDALTEGETWKSPDEQKARFAGLKPEDEIIVYCGSGVTACPNILALQEAGFRNVKLYAGSWSDWISYEENPIATSEEEA